MTSLHYLARFLPADAEQFEQVKEREGGGEEEERERKSGVLFIDYFLNPLPVFLYFRVSYLR